MCWVPGPARPGVDDLKAMRGMLDELKTVKGRNPAVSQPGTVQVAESKPAYTLEGVLTSDEGRRSGPRSLGIVR